MIVKQYKTKAVQALAEMWAEYEPALKEVLDNMGMIEKVALRSLFQIVSVPDLLAKLDSSPKAVETIKRGMLRVVEAMKEDEKPEIAGKE